MWGMAKATENASGYLGKLRIPKGALKSRVTPLPFGPHSVTKIATFSTVGKCIAFQPPFCHKKNVRKDSLLSGSVQAGPEKEVCS